MTIGYKENRVALSVTIYNKLAVRISSGATGKLK